MTNAPERFPRRELLTFNRWRRTIPTDDQVRERAVRQVRRGMRRRQFLQNTVVGTAAGYMLHLLPNVAWELAIGEYTSQVDFLDGQEERLRSGKTDSLAVVFGGANTRSADIQAKPIKNELGYLGAVTYVKYAVDDVDIKGIADQLEKYQKKYPHLKKLSLYGVSLGTQVAGKVMAELERRKSSLRLEHLIMDSTPVDFADTDHPGAAKLIRPLQLLRGDAVLTAVANNVVWGGPFKKGSTPPGLYASQGVTLLEGASSLSKLSAIAARHGTRVAFLRANDPSKDTTINPIRAEERLRRDYFPNMETFTVSGSETNGVPDTDHREGHGNPDQNGIGYRAALTDMLKKWGFIA